MKASIILSEQEKAELQVEVDTNFEATVAVWKEMKKASGKSHFLFIISREATQFLGEFEVIRQQVLSMGLTIPQLDDKISVTITQVEED